MPPKYRVRTRITKPLTRVGAASATALVSHAASAGIVYNDIDDINVNATNAANVSTNVNASVNGNDINFNFGTDSNNNLTFNTLNNANNNVTAVNNPLNLNDPINANTFAGVNNNEFSLGNLNNTDANNWTSGEKVYLGLAVTLTNTLANSPASNTFFGWVGLSLGNPDSLVIQDFAFEDNPGQGIAAGATSAPEPGTLALLALGATGIAAWRRRRAEQGNKHLPSAAC